MSPRPPARILLVDREGSNLDVMRMLIEQQGHACSVATSANAALVLCQQQKFDCAFIHASLDGASGVALVQRLRIDSQARPRHVVLMSGFPRHEFTTQLREQAADAFLRKPVEADELIAVLNRCLADNATNAG